MPKENDYAEMIKKMIDLGIITQETAIESEQYEGKSLEESEQEVLAMFKDQKIEDWANTLTFEDLSRLSFDKAKQVIQHLTFATRLKYLKKLDETLLYLYESTKAYNAQGFGKSMPVKDFMHIMGRIKHLEIIQNWLYGIN